jgi:LysR family cys regulon transcriptional activator
MTTHSDHIDADHEPQDSGNDLINQFFSSQGTTIPSDYKSGFVAIVGRPNVGKSTLMNHILGQKLSITSRKPQTTRHKIVGIDSREKSQAVFVDTPGMHKKEVRAINKMMNRAAHSALRDVNLVLFVLDADKWTQNDELVLEKLKNAEMPVILVINKVDEGTLTIATTHTQARYVLPPIVNKFKKEFPKVHLILQQASPVEITEMLLQGEADIGIATESLTAEDNLASVPFYTWQHSIITPQNHPLTANSNITIEDLSHYPIITYHGGFTGRSKIDEAFEEAGFDVDIVMSALDADVIKTYVELNMGVGIVNNVAYDAERDYRLKQIPTDIFGVNTTWIAVRKGHLLRGYGYEFISLCSPDADIKALKKVAYPDD